MTQRADVAIIGGGIVGIAHARAAARRGHKVVLFERDTRAVGASVRNFGMIWPIGQPAGQLHQQALHSRAIWLELANQAGIWVNACGSLHLAHADDEWAVLAEFAARAKDLGYECSLLSPSQTRERCPAGRVENLRGALWSPTECCVDPRQALAKLPGWLRDVHGVDLQFGTTITAVDLPSVRTSTGQSWHVDRVIVAGGIDFQTLFPQEFAAAGLQKCKLQMMRTVPQPNQWHLGPHVAGGLTLGHYAAFRVCSALPALVQRQQAEFAEHGKYGIHVMASQNELGEVVIGDSHEYGDAIEPFDKAVIDELILGYLRRLIDLPDWSIAGRWHGLYPKHPTLPVVRIEPAPGVTITPSPGGAGMTLAFGLAESYWA